MLARVHGLACKVSFFCKVFRAEDASRMDETEAPATKAPATEAPARAEPVIRRISRYDVVEAFASGLRDFQAKPVYGLAFGLFYALGGALIIACLSVLDVTYLAYPLTVGFAMLGPFIASGLYEVSRRREIGAPLSFRVVLTAIWDQRSKELSWMAFVALFVVIIWLYQVRLLLALFLGLRSFSSLGEFITVITTTPEGLVFLAIGHAVGAALCLLAFSLTVVSFPLLVDRDIDFITAIITSVRAVMANPVPMIGWALCVVLLLIIGAMPMFLGLIVVLPILGHATWHLYRRLVEPLPSVGA
jgi:uncharacterized membrane protein